MFILKIFRFATGVAFLVLIAAVLVQIGGRLIGNSPVWTEELTRYALLYLAAFGVGLSFLNGNLVNVDLICENLPSPWPKWLRLIAATATSALGFILIIPAWKFTEIGALQSAPALGWRMDFIHASVFVLLVSLALFSLSRVIAILMGRSDGRPIDQFEDET